MDITAALTFALDNPYSDFYRMRTPQLKAHAPLSSFPFLTRDDIARTPFSARTFIPSELIRFIRSTSGTTGRGVVVVPMAEEYELMQLRAAQGFGGEHHDPGRYFGSYFMPEDDFALMTFTPMGPPVETYLAVASGHRSVMGDFRDPARTAALAHSYGIDSLMAFVPVVRSLTPAFSAAGICGTIRLLVMVGERLQAAHRAALVTDYPKARIVSLYASTESQAAVGCTCPKFETEAPNRLHIMGTFTPELIDPDTREVLPLERGTRGELVITSMTPLPLPLIRYRTGDYVEVHATGPCDCGATGLLFEVIGRAEFDRVKVPFGGITTAALEEAIFSLPLQSQDFAAHFDQRSEPNGLSVTLYSDQKCDDNLSELLALRLRVSSTRTYADLVLEGVVRPLEVTLLPVSAAAGSGKRLRLTIER